VQRDELIDRTGRTRADLAVGVAPQPDVENRLLTPLEARLPFVRLLVETTIQRQLDGAASPASHPFEHVERQARDALRQDSQAREHRRHLQSVGRVDADTGGRAGRILLVPHSLLTGEPKNSML